MSKRTPQPPAHLSADAQEAWTEVVKQHPRPEKITGPALEAYANTIALQRDAEARVQREGQIIADERGTAIPHPAIEIARNARHDVMRWAEKFTPAEDDNPLGF